MCYRNDGAGIVGQVAFEPGDRLGVEVVRRLIEQQQVGLGEQQASQRNTALLPARQRGYLGLGRRGAQRVHGDLDSALDVPTFLGVELFFDGSLPGPELVVVRLGVSPASEYLVVLLEQLGDIADAIEDVVVDVLGRRRVGALA